MTDRPVLITDAKESYQEQLARRRKRYAITMSMRIPFLIAAVLTISTPWLALTLIMLSVPLPWIAVLIANDGPARDQKARKVLPGTISYDRAIEARHEVIDAAPSDRAF
ncbi:MAG: DUF3099 domain-containing protein [Nakamurella sp.]